MKGWFPDMTTTQDKIKLIAAVIVLALSVVFNHEVDSGNEELVTAISVLLSYFIGLYTDTYGKKDKIDE